MLKILFLTDKSGYRLKICTNFGHIVIVLYVTDIASGVHLKIPILFKQLYRWIRQWL